jgi:SynChlorMet cassette radical SAM/SPASM protein ScmE
MWLNLLKELAELKVFNVRFSGGEPFMRHDIWRILEAADSLPMRLSINTNATLVDQDVAKRLSGMSRVDEIMVSLDGSSPDTHDLLRGTGSFELTMRGVHNLIDKDLPVSFYCTVTRYNYEDLDSMFRLARELGPCSIKFNYLMPEGRGREHYPELALSRPEWQHVLETLRRLKSRDEKMVSGTVLDLGELFDDMVACSKDLNYPQEPSFLCGCGALIDECAVTPDGWITPCDRISGLKAGHIRDGNFQQVWQSSEVFQNFRSRREVPLSRLENCSGCEYIAACTGGCAAVAYTLCGNIMDRDPLACYRIYLGEEHFEVL